MPTKKELVSFVSLAVLVMAAFALNDALKGRSLIPNPRESNREFLTSHGPVCGKYLTANEKLEWERLDDASAQRMAAATCQQLASMLNILGDSHGGRVPMAANQIAEPDPLADCKLSRLQVIVWHALGPKADAQMARNLKTGIRSCEQIRAGLDEFGSVALEASARRH